MTYDRRAVVMAAFERIRAKQALCIPVRMVGFAHMKKETDKKWPDTFHWVIGDEARAFIEGHGVEVMTSRCSDEHDVTTVFFPKDRPEVAQEFEAKFA